MNAAAERVRLCMVLGGHWAAQMGGALFRGLSRRISGYGLRRADAIVAPPDDHTRILKE